MRKQFGMALATSLSMSGMVCAQGVEVGKWTGPFAGGQIDLVSYEESAIYSNSSVIAESFRGKSYIIDSRHQNLTGFVGYDYQVFHNFLVGGEFGVVFLGSEDEGETLGVSYDIAINQGYYLRSRLGWLPRENILLYMNLGQGFYEGEGELVYQGSTIDSEFSVEGFEVGFGFEYRISENVSARAAYNYISEDETGDEYFELPQFSMGRLGLGAAWRF